MFTPDMIAPSGLASASGRNENSGQAGDLCGRSSGRGGKDEWLCSDHGVREPCRAGCISGEGTLRGRRRLAEDRGRDHECRSHKWREKAVRCV